MDSDDEYSDNGDNGDHGDSTRPCSSDESDEEICMELDQPPKPNRFTENDGFTFEVLNTDEIVVHQRQIIDEVNNVLNLSPTMTRMLLNHYRWDKEKIFEQYFDGNTDEFFRNAHVINPFKMLSETSLPNCESGASVAATSNRIQPIRKSDSEYVVLGVEGYEECKNTEEECGICFCSSEILTGLQCGHRFCPKCWKNYLAGKTFSEGLGQSISCPAHNCDILVDDVTFAQLADDRRVQERYNQIITNSFVECNALMRWCPAPNCLNAIKVNYPDAHAVECKCGHLFCFRCGEDWHEPVNCGWLKKWLKKCTDDSETTNWIAANTKECPKCNVTIEKDGGCNHMVCKNPNCKHDFCWVCLGSWEPHGSSWYNCNRYDEDEARAARYAQEKLRSSMARYLHYYNRYMNHQNSLKLENKLNSTMRIKMEEMQQEMSWIEVQFLKNAVDILRQCRQTMMYTYVFAYYLRRNNQKIIFEDNQRDLEQATELLSEYLERDISSENLYQIKQKVLDKSQYCEKRRTVLLDHVHEGYDRDWWESLETL